MGKKVLVLGSFADSLIRFRGALIAEMVRRGHTVVACAPDIDDRTAARLAALGARAESVPMRRANIDPLSDLRLIYLLIALLRRERPDAMLSYTIKPVVFGGIAARIVGGIDVVPMITGLGFAFTGGKGLYRAFVREVAKRLYRAGLSGVSRVVFQNPDDRQFFLENGLLTRSSSTCLVPGSGIDLREYAQAPVGTNTNFLMIARLVRDKGVVEYAEAARRVRARFPQTRFRLAGWRDDNPTSISEQQLEEWVAEGTIDFLGRLDDVRPALSDCSVYVLPSYREGTPRTVLEAMAVGRAVITTDAPGCRETVVPNVNGFLVPVANVGALEEAMCKLLSEPQLVRQFGSASRRVAEKKFDVQIVNERLLESMGLKT
jgi:glycosyltransferase involved in cell wall biosynthesis